MSGALLNQAVCAALYRPLKGGGGQEEKSIEESGGGGGGGGGGRGGGEAKRKEMVEEERRLVETIAKLEEENPTAKNLNLTILAPPQDVRRYGPLPSVRNTPSDRLKLRPSVRLGIYAKWAPPARRVPSSVGPSVRWSTLG